MIALLQRVTEARVTVGDKTIAAIASGLLVFVGVVREDGSTDVTRLAERLLSYRVFAGEHGRMNRSLRDVQGGILIVPQFTLAADTQRGTRAGFSHAAEPKAGEALFEQLLGALRARYEAVEAGQFGAYMQVHLVNDGPVTFWLSTR